jgi:hypothetical protein
MASTQSNFTHTFKTDHKQGKIITANKESVKTENKQFLKTKHYVVLQLASPCAKIIGNGEKSLTSLGRHKQSYV